MRKILLFVMLAVATFVTAQDNKFVIRGEMSSVTLCYIFNEFFIFNYTNTFLFNIWSQK